MGHKFAEIAFTDNVKKIQTEQNSRNNYAAMEQGEDFNHLLSQREADFIHARDSFYMASVSETNWPYVQHRGGPTGFLKVLDANTIGFADFTGNRQYVSTGNFIENNRVSLILMDYPNRTRLKILGTVTVIPEHDLETLIKLEDDGYRARVERGFIIKIEAFDWNCPKHITPRYVEADIEKMLAPIIAENEALKESATSVDSHNQYPETIGEGPLELIVTGIRQLTPQIRAYEFRSTEGTELPVVDAGSHLALPVILEDQSATTRNYSICSNPARRDIYEVAVQLEQNGTGGSKAIHKNFNLGQKIKCPWPLNHFSLENDTSPVVLIAGGIGITPIKAMAQQLQNEGKEFQIHYAGKSPQKMAFLDRLQREFGSKLSTYFSSEKQRLSPVEIIRHSPANTQFYLCGPDSLISAFRIEAKIQGLEQNQVHYERFSAAPIENNKAVTLKLARTNKTIAVTSEQSLLDAMLEQDIAIPFSCQTGQCKSCVVKVLDGDVQHNDDVLSVEEKEQQRLMCPCVSRATTETLTLDL